MKLRPISHKFLWFLLFYFGAALESLQAAQTMVNLLSSFVKIISITDAGQGAQGGNSRNKIAILPPPNDEEMQFRSSTLTELEHYLYRMKVQSIPGTIVTYKKRDFHIPNSGESYLELELLNSGNYDFSVVFKLPTGQKIEKKISIIFSLPDYVFREIAHQKKKAQIVEVMFTAVTGFNYFGSIVPGENRTSNRLSLPVILGDVEFTSPQIDGLAIKGSIVASHLQRSAVNPAFVDIAATEFSARYDYDAFINPGGVLIKLSAGLAGALYNQNLGQRKSSGQLHLLALTLLNLGPRFELEVYQWGVRANYQWRWAPYQTQSAKSGVTGAYGQSHEFNFQFRLYNQTFGLIGANLWDYNSKDADLEVSESNSAFYLGIRQSL